MNVRRIFGVALWVVGGALVVEADMTVLGVIVGLVGMVLVFAPNR